MTANSEAVQSTPVPQISKPQSFSIMDTAAAQSITVPKSTKVCVVCSYSYKEAWSYAVTIADLQLEVGGDVSDESFISIRPTFLIDKKSFDGSIHTFCVLNSTLYMIEMGFRRGGGPRRGKSVYTWDLSPYLEDGGGGGGGDGDMLSKDVLLAAPEMLHPKFFPFATPTPDGKRIVVFSSMMPFPTENPDEQIDFEVYDPKKGGGYPWRKLSSLRDSLRGTRCDIEIQGFTFLTNSKMLFRTTVGKFVFDIDVPDLGWRKEDSYFGAKIFPFQGRFFVTDDDDDDDEIQLCVAGTGAYDISSWAQREYRERVFDWDKASWFPISSFARDFRFEVRRFIKTDVVYNKDRRHLQVVHLQTAVEKGTRIARMLLDVSEYNLKKYEEEEVVEGEGPEKKKCPLNASVVKSFKFKFDREMCRSFIPVCLSVIQA